MKKYPTCNAVCTHKSKLNEGEKYRYHSTKGVIKLADVILKESTMVAGVITLKLEVIKALNDVVETGEEFTVYCRDGLQIDCDWYITSV